MPHGSGVAVSRSRLHLVGDTSPNELSSNRMYVPSLLTRLPSTRSVPPPSTSFVPGGVRQHTVRREQRKAEPSQHNGHTRNQPQRHVKPLGDVSSAKPSPANTTTTHAINHNAT
jgi:hypothetical protein